MIFFSTETRPSLLFSLKPCEKRLFVCEQTSRRFILHLSVYKDTYVI